MGWIFGRRPGGSGGANATRPIPARRDAPGMAGGPSSGWRRMFGWRPTRAACLAAAAWAAVASFPSVIVPPPPPYAVGAIAGQDIPARVDFPWRDVALEKRELRLLDESFPNRYREIDADAWTAEVIAPFRRAYELVRSVETPAAFPEALHELSGIRLTPDEASVLGTALGRLSRLEADSRVYIPLGQMIRNEIHPLGLMDDERYRIERGRNIHVRHASNRSADRIVAVGLHLPWTPGGEARPIAGLESWLDRRLETEGQWRGQFAKPFRAAARKFLLARATPTLRFDEEATIRDRDELAARVRERGRRVHAGEMLIARDRRVTPETWAKMRAEADAWQRAQTWWRPWARWCGGFLVLLALGLAFVLYAAFAERVPEIRLKSMAAAAAAGLWAVGWSYGLAWFGMTPAIAPLGLAVGILALGLRPRLAVAGTIGAALAMLGVWEARADAFAGLLTASFLSALVLPRMRWRGTLVGVSLSAGLAGAAVLLAWRLGADGGFLAEGEFLNWGGAISEAVAMVVSWGVCGLVLMTAPRPVEWFFDVTTRVRVQECLESDRPLLRRMLEEAPGTYQHSVVVAALAEAGAEAAGGDGLTARAGGYYHDIGKLSKPEYFSENETGASRHTRLTPAMSVMVLFGHVKDGDEYAEAARLPPAIQAAVREHHGTGAASYFLHKAKTHAAMTGDRVNEADFRYPGPRPRRVESAAVMMADTVEAAVRSARGAPGRLRDLVHRLFADRLRDGQFAEAGLTLAELARMEDAFVRMLGGMYHDRVKYPDSPAADAAPSRTRRQGG